MAKRTTQDYLVIGLGRFGTSVALKLTELGYSVLAIDQDRRIVQDLADELTQVVSLDATDEDAMQTVGVEAFDTAIVAIGADFESNLLITSLLKELGVKRVVCKALNKRQKTILEKVGADEVVLPEYEAGVRVARQLASETLIDSLELEPGVSVSELRCTRHLAGHTLRELKLPERFGVTVLMIRGDHMHPAPNGNDRIAQSDRLLVIGPDKGISDLEDWQP